MSTSVELVAHSIPLPPTAPTLTRDMGLQEAGNAWLSTKENWKRRKPRTIEASRCYLNSLIKFFGNIRLDEIHAGSLVAYQAERSKEVGASYINHELNSLAQMLKKAGLWDALKGFYAPLKEPEWQKPRVFTPEEQQHIFESAKEDPNLELADIVFTITRNTSASGCELRLARLRSLDLEAHPPTFNITGDTTKNTIRPRLIPLNKDAEAAFRRAVTRAAKCGAHRPEHFIFPLRVNRALWDPNKPASRSWLRCQTSKLRERTGVKHLRPHVWRHQLCTEMLEQGVPPQTVKGVMGWCSEKMIAVYSHTRIEAKVQALGVLEHVGHKQVQKSAHILPGQSPDIMHAAIQAEIARQVALALQQQGYVALPDSAPTAKGPRLLAFPGAR